MCGDQDPAQAPPRRSTLSRRRFLTAAGSLAAIAALPGRPWELPAQAAVTGLDGTSPFSMAMHIHSAFSEQAGSMEGHLQQAQQNAVDVIWWTDHDHRMAGGGYRKTVHFTSLTAEQPAKGEGSPWEWAPATDGGLTAESTGGIVASPSSPKDPVVDGSLRVSAQSTGTSPASLGFSAESHGSGWNYQGSLIGQTLSIEVLPTSVFARDYLELLITSSAHPSVNGRPAGNYSLSYRMGAAPASRSATGLLGVVNKKMTVGAWNSKVLRPAEDIAALWPDMDARDFGLFELTLRAVSNGGPAAGYFDYLRFARSSGDVQLQAQQDMELAYASRYAGVMQRQGLEVSAQNPHVNWFGGAVSIPGLHQGSYSSWLQQTVIPQIHSSGGLASYNHPYGATGGSPLSQTVQDQRLITVAQQLLANRALGADILEVGYPGRGGCDLAHHVGLWDVLSRNAVFLTANGVSDDHFGTHWAGLGNNWVTSTWAADKAEASLLAGLAAGRAWTASLTGYRGSLDILADGGCPMGSASVSTVSSRQLTVTATDLPSGATLEVLQGSVDYAGATSPATRLLQSYGAGDLTGGSRTIPVDTSTSSFVRTQVRSSAGKVVALSNPVWLLRDAPPSGIPTPRAR